MHSLEQLLQLSGAADVASFHMFVYKMRPCGYVSASAQHECAFVFWIGDSFWQIQYSSYCCSLLQYSCVPCSAKVAPGRSSSRSERVTPSPRWCNGFKSGFLMLIYLLTTICITVPAVRATPLAELSLFTSGREGETAGLQVLSLQLCNVSQRQHRARIGALLP
jgi:hypothetical protein